MEAERVQVQVPEVNPLLEIFSPEVWKLSLSKIKDPKDLWNATHADPLFRGLIKSDEKMWMPMLLSLTLPQLGKQLKKSDILNLRLVSKNWRKSVDHLLEDGNGWKRRDEADECEFRLLLANDPEIDSFQKFSDVVAELRADPGKKLVGGYVEAWIMKNDPVVDRLAFFQEQGHKIFHLETWLDSEQGSWDYLEAVDCVRQILTTTPNLKTLQVIVDFEGRRMEFPGVSWKDEVAQHLQQNPLPALPDLMGLELKHYEIWTEYPRKARAESVLMCIYQAYLGHIKKLTLCNVDLTPEVINTNSLVSLTLDLLSAEPGSLEDLGKVKAHLKKLKLTLRIGMFVNHHRMFIEALESFGETLTKLELDLRGYDPKMKIVYQLTEKVNLPCLQKIIIELHWASSQTRFDFLLNFPKLREVKIYISNYYDLGENTLLGAKSGDDEDCLKIRPGQWDNQAHGPGTFTSRRIWEKLTWLQSVSIMIWSKKFYGQ